MGEQAVCTMEYRRTEMEWLDCYGIVCNTWTVASLSSRKHETQSMYRAQSVPVGQEWLAKDQRCQWGLDQPIRETK